MAGQQVIDVDVTYDDGTMIPMTFYGNAYGGPVLQSWKDFSEWVTHPEWYGPFGKRWVRRYYGLDSN